MRLGSLFSGAGLGDMGFHAAGLVPAWFCEINPFARRVLKLRWPGVPIHPDVRKLSGTGLPRVEVLAGGFPCQPHSVSGRRRGTSDRRELWSEFARLIREIQPRWVVVENVRGILSSENGRFFGRVLGDLAQSGYDAGWRVLAAAEFGAPHLRERVLVLAHARGRGPFPEEFFQAVNPQKYRRAWQAESLGRDILLGRFRFGGLPKHLRIRHGGPLWMDRLECLGNGLIPQAAHWIAQIIQRAETKDKTHAESLARGFSGKKQARVGRGLAGLA